MTTREQQDIVRSKGLCGALSHDREHVCILSAYEPHIHPWDASEHLRDVLLTDDEAGLIEVIFDQLYALGCDRPPPDGPGVDLDAFRAKLERCDDVNDDGPEPVAIHCPVHDKGSP
jgi:hypothetical protein